MVLIKHNESFNFYHGHVNNVTEIPSLDNLLKIERQGKVSPVLQIGYISIGFAAKRQCKLLRRQKFVIKIDATGNNERSLAYVPNSFAYTVMQFPY